MLIARGVVAAAALLSLPPPPSFDVNQQDPTPGRQPPLFSREKKRTRNVSSLPVSPFFLPPLSFLPILSKAKKGVKKNFFLPSSKPVDLQRRLLHDLVVHQERRRAHALVALQLDDRAQFGVVDHGAVAAELLLEGLDDLLVVERLVEPLDGRQGLAAVALLDADVDIVLGRCRRGASGGGALGRGGLLLGVGGVGKRV